MKYENTVKGKFIKRINRFIAICEIKGKEERVYVPNTGRCRELFIEGADAVFTESSSSERKTKYTLVNIEKGNLLINIDSQAPNRLVEEALKNGLILKEEKIVNYRREYTYGNSRFDFYLERETGPAFLEVKGVTLENEGHATFPDAPTLRGLKHVEELIKATENGYGAYIVFVLQMSPMKDFIPNAKMQPEFSDAVKKAIKKGVKVYCYECRVTENSVVITDEVPLGKF